MAQNRRDFIKGSAIVGVVGASAASAEQRLHDDPPWIGFLHSTALEPDLEDAFVEGLKSDTDTPNVWNGNSSSPLDAPNRVVIRKVSVRGKYGRSQTNPLRNAAQDTQQLTPNPKLLVAAGGNVVAIAVNGLTYGTKPIPVLVAMGRPDSSISQSNIKKIILENDSRDLLAKKIGHLQANFSVTSFSQMVLFYNGNSKMSQPQLDEWASLTGSAGKQIDASDPTNFSATVGTADKDNTKIKLKDAIQAAIGLTSGQSVRAIIVTSDSYFTMHRGKIIRLIKNLTTRRVNPIKNLVMCYPLDEYDQDAQQAGFDPDTDFAIVGPSLTDVYNLLGRRAAQILGNVGTVPDTEAATIVTKP